MQLYQRRLSREVLMALVYRVMVNYTASLIPRLRAGGGLFSDIMHSMHNEHNNTDTSNSKFPTVPR